MPAPVRPHLAAVLARTAHVLIGFDTVASATRTPGTGLRLHDLMIERGERLGMGWRFLAGDDDRYVIAVDRGHGREAFAMYAGAEREATADAAPRPHVGEFLAACRESGRSVAVAGNYDQRVVNVYLKRHGLARDIDRVLCRKALLPTSVDDVAPSVGAPPGSIAAVSDSARSLWRAGVEGMLRIGVEGGDDRRKFLAGQGDLVLTNTGATRAHAVASMWPVAHDGLMNGHLLRGPDRPDGPGAPVVSNLGRLAEAMLAIEAPKRRRRWFSR